MKSHPATARAIPDMFSNRKSDKRILVRGHWRRVTDLLRLTKAQHNETAQVISVDDLMPMSMLDILKP